MWELDGQAYNQSDIQSVADRLGISFDEYVKKFNLKKLDDSIDIMEEIEPTTFTLSDTFNQLSTQSVDDSIYNMDASESSENIKTLLDGIVKPAPRNILEPGCNPVFVNKYFKLIVASPNAFPIAFVKFDKEFSSL